MYLIDKIIFNLAQCLKLTYNSVNCIVYINEKDTKLFDSKLFAGKLFY